MSLISTHGRIISFRTILTNYLDARLAGLALKNVFWLEVAVNNIQLSQHVKGDQDGVSEVADQRLREALELVSPDQLVQVERHELKHDTDVLAEEEAVEDVDSVRIVLLVFLSDVLQNFNFFLGLL